MDDALPVAYRPILVTGLPRSGTSLIAGCLERCGAFVGRCVEPTPENPKGFFENAFLRDEIDKRLLRALHADPRGVDPLPALAEVPGIRGLERVVLEALRIEGYDGRRPWLFKDAKLTLLWPAWATAFPAARWVIVRRREEDVVRSCLRTGFMRRRSGDPRFWRLFCRAYLDRLERLKASGAWWREIWPGGLVGGDLAPIERLCADLGLEPAREAIRRFVAPEHWHAPAG
ncbi:MAG: hypothetical protein D6718_12070 [Acidobacteria bacterium]|nr:MAG: hypothetical protein D6718_12070 [Acidobacteriota bacterium]